MPRKTERQGRQDAARSDRTDGMVPAMFAGTLKEAERCSALLREHGIPAEIGEEDDPRGEGVGIAVFVPDDSLDAASKVLTEHRSEEEEVVEVRGAREAGNEDYEDEGFDDYEDDDDETDLDDDEAWDADEEDELESDDEDEF